MILSNKPQFSEGEMVMLSLSKRRNSLLAKFDCRDALPIAWVWQSSPTGRGLIAPFDRLRALLGLVDCNCPFAKVEQLSGEMAYERRTL